MKTSQIIICVKVLFYIFFFAVEDIIQTQSKIIIELPKAFWLFV